MKCPWEDFDWFAILMNGTFVDRKVMETHVVLNERDDIKYFGLYGQQTATRFYVDMQNGGFYKDGEKLDLGVECPPPDGAKPHWARRVIQSLPVSPDMKPRFLFGYTWENVENGYYCLLVSGDGEWMIDPESGFLKE